MIAVPQRAKQRCSLYATKTTTITMNVSAHDCYTTARKAALFTRCDVLTPRFLFSTISIFQPPGGGGQRGSWSTRRGSFTNLASFLQVGLTAYIGRATTRFHIPTARAYSSRVLEPDIAGGKRHICFTAPPHAGKATHGQCSETSSEEEL